MRDVHLREETRGETARAVSGPSREGDGLAADLEVASRLRDALLIEALADIKAPLASITLAATVLDRKLASSSQSFDALREWVHDVRDAATQAVLLVEALRAAFGELSATVDLRAHPTAPLFEIATNAVKPLARARRARVLIEVREGADRLYCDRAATLHALVALLTVGLRRTVAGGRVRIVAAHTGLATHLSVSDEGVTLDEDAVERMLDHTVDDGRALLAHPLFVAQRAAIVQGGTLTIKPDATRGMVFDLSLASPM